MSTGVGIAYLVSIALFVFGLKRLAGVRTARSGNALAAAAMLVAVIATLVDIGLVDYRWIAAGLVAGSAIGAAIALRAKATAMPQVVARFNGFGGGASALVAVSLFWLEVVEADAAEVAAGALGTTAAVTLVLSVLVGASTFSGSVVAELKLAGRLKGTPRIPARTAVVTLLGVGGLILGLAAMFVAAEPASGAGLVLALLAMSLLAGCVLVLPIGGADMPVVIALLNSLSGLAAAATGFAIGNNLLVIVGTIVGAAGLILTTIMCKAMNRSLINVIAGGAQGDGAGDEGQDYEHILSTHADEAAMLLEAASSVIIVPGYGLAAARAQHSAYDLAKALSERGTDVRFAIHPVAGRMPGHMNVVLAEADVPYEQLYELDQINQDFKNTDVAIVVGANDVVNPAANTQPDSPIAGMPILDVGDAAQVLVIKRSLSPGYSGIRNELFEADNTMMLFGDAKDILSELSAELAQAAPV